MVGGIVAEIDDVGADVVVATGPVAIGVVVVWGGTVADKITSSMPSDPPGLPAAGLHSGKKALEEAFDACALVAEVSGRK